MMTERQILNIKYGNFNCQILIYVKSTRVTYYDYVKTIITYLHL
jgi:hypothetical protein